MTFLQNCVYESSKMYESIMWGKIITSILTQKWNDALSSYSKMLSILISRSNHSNSQRNLVSINQLMHISVFVHSTDVEHVGKMAESILSDKELVNTLISINPHLVKYIICGSIIDMKIFTKYRQEIKYIVSHLKYIYRDSFIDFINENFITYNLLNVPHHINSCFEALTKDFFLAEFANNFKRNSSILYILNHCKVYNKVKFSDLANILNLSEEELHEEVKNCIEEKKLFAVIDKNAEGFESNIENSRKENLIEKSEDLLAKCDKILDSF